MRQANGVENDEEYYEIHMIFSHVLEDNDNKTFTRAFKALLQTNLVTKSAKMVSDNHSIVDGFFPTVDDFIKYLQRNLYTCKVGYRKFQENFSKISKESSNDDEDEEEDEN